MSKRASVKTVFDYLNEIAPFETAESFDNVGLLIGSMHAPVERILVALDATPAVVQEALDLDVQLIVTHHPILFRGRKNLREDDVEGRMLCSLIRSNIALIAAHTNFDNAVPGVNNALADLDEAGILEGMIGMFGDISNLAIACGGDVAQIVEELKKTGE